MLRFTRITSLTAIVVLALSVTLADAAGARKQARTGSEGRGSKKAGLSTAATLVAKFLAKDAGLAADKADAFVKAYVDEREASVKRMTEARKSGDTQKAKGMVEEAQKGIDTVLGANLTAEQAKKAKEYDLIAMERSIETLMRAKAGEAKVEEALPVLAKYHKAAEELRAKVRAKEMKRADAEPKDQELRTAAVKDLTPIVGEEAAKAWQGTGRTSGLKEKGAGEQKRGEGAKPGRAGKRGGGVTAPVAP